MEPYDQIIELLKPKTRPSLLEHVKNPRSWIYRLPDPRTSG